MSIRPWPSASFAAAATAPASVTSRRRCAAGRLLQLGEQRLVDVGGDHARAFATKASAVARPMPWPAR
jgi:hypothetical protein